MRRHTPCHFDPPQLLHTPPTFPLSFFCPLSLRLRRPVTLTPPSAPPQSDPAAAAAPAAASTQESLAPAPASVSAAAAVVVQVSVSFFGSAPVSCCAVLGRALGARGGLRLVRGLAAALAAQHSMTQRNTSASSNPRVSYSKGTQYGCQTFCTAMIPHECRQQLRGLSAQGSRGDDPREIRLHKASSQHVRALSTPQLHQLLTFLLVGLAPLAAAFVV